MNRSPLFYPMNRGSDGEAGGAGDLQTDVMRFMAILSLCLVAIFALVHSIPADERRPDNPAEETLPPAAESQLATSEPEPAEEPETLQVMNVVEVETTLPAEPVVEQSEPEVVDVEDIELHYPVAKRPEPRTAEPTETTEAPTPLPRETAEAAPPAESAPQPAPAQEGFSLRFEDDLALTRLVARNEVGMYAMRDDKAMRMNVNRGAIGFWAASSPGRFHEMEPATVPEPVLDAYRRNGDATAVKWAVTLPPGMSRQLDDYLSRHSGGSIIIAADGEMRLEQ